MSADWDAIRTHLSNEGTDVSEPVDGETLVTAVETATDATIGTGVVEQAAANGVIETVESDDDPFRATYRVGVEDANAIPELPVVDCSNERDVTLAEAPEYSTAEEYRGPSMEAMPQWMLRLDDDKAPKAPWLTGDISTNARWGSTKTDRPETTFSRASNWATSLPRNLSACYLLPHDVEKYEVTVIMVDIDDCVREDGTVPREVLDILERLATYVEVSLSEEGFHAFGFGRLPDGVTQVVEHLHTDEQPQGEPIKIEMYQSGRMCMTTGWHLSSTPSDLCDISETVVELVDEYVDDEDRPTEEELRQNARDELFGDDSDESDDSDCDRSPYFSHSLGDVVPTTGLSNRGHELKGPHPVHGSSKGQNFALRSDHWRCFRCDSAGNALQYIAVEEGFIYCDESSNGGLDALAPTEYTRLCLTARDKYDFEGEPPWKALLGVAEEYGLAEDGTFSYQLKTILCNKYDESTARDF